MMQPMTPEEQIRAEARINYGFQRWNKEHMRLLKDVLDAQGAKRWRLAAHLVLKLNPKNPNDPNMDLRKETEIIMQECKELRKLLAQSDNEMGKSADKHSGRRYALRMPATMLQFIELIDPEVLSGSSHERRKSVQKLTKAFPEFQVLTRV